MVQLAASHPGRAVSAREIAEKQGISAKYLEHILRALKSRGLVRAVRGKQGGYILTRSPESITLKDLYESVCGGLSPEHCVARPDTCPMREVCPVWETFLEVKGGIETVLGRTTVQELLARIERKATLRASKRRAGVTSPAG